MAAREIHRDRLDSEGRERLRRLLEQKPILSEGGVASARMWWILLALAGAGLLALAFLGKLGVVEGDYGRIGVLALPTYFLGALFLVRGALGAAGAAGTPWPPIKALYPFGVLDARSTTVRFLPIADFDRVVIHRDSPGVTDATYFKIEIHFKGSPPELFRLFGFEKNLPHEALGTLGAPVEVLLPESAEAAPRRPPRRWLWSLIAGLAVAAGVYAGLLPLRSVASAEASGRPDHWRAVERAFPFGWIATRARQSIHARYEAARAALGTQAEPFRRLLDELERRGDPQVSLLCAQPPAPQLDAATAWLKERADRAGVGYAKVWVTYASTGDVPGEEIMARQLGEVIEARIPRDLLRLDRWHESHPKDAPRIVVSFDLAPTTVYQAVGGKRLFAGSTLTYAASLVVPGQPPIVLAKGVEVPPPDSLEVSRLAFEGEKLPTIGESGILEEDIMVYTDLVGAAAGKAAPLLAAQLFPQAL